MRTAKLALYAQMPITASDGGPTTVGTPLINSSGLVSWDVLNYLARYDLITLDIAWHHRPEILEWLADRSVQVLAFVRGTAVWGGPADADEYAWRDNMGFWAELKHYADRENAHIRTQSGAPGLDGRGTNNLDISRPEVAEAFVRIVRYYSRHCDAVFLDWANRNPEGWLFDPADPPILDLPKWKAGLDYIMAMLPAPPRLPGMANSNSPAGGFVENFPYFNGTWQRNVDIVKDGGWINVQSPVVYPQVTEETRRRMRFGLGTALLFDAYFGIGGRTEYDALSGVTGPAWWFPEFDLDLGNPKGPAVEHLPGRLWRRDFQKGRVFVNTGSTFAGGTEPQDARFMVFD